MLGLLADVHCDLRLEAMLAVCQNPEWRDYWRILGVRIFSFESLEADRRIKDAALWALCQTHGIILVTANRNDDGPDSPQATIRKFSTTRSLPVLTIANPDLMLADSAYANRAAVRMMEILTDIDVERGTGRLYLPSNVEG